MTTLRLVSTILSLSIAFALSANNRHCAPVKNFDERQVADSLTSFLRAANTPADSLGIYIDLFDVQPRDQRIATAKKAVDLSLKVGNSLVGLDMIRNLANLNYSSDSALRSLRDLALQFPPSDNRQETLLFIDVARNYSSAWYSKPNERVARLNDIIAKLNDDQPKDVYDRILALSAICINMQDMSNTGLLEKYLDQVDREISTLRPQALPLRSIFCMFASLAYANSTLAKAKGIKYDRRMLDIIDSLEAGHSGMCRKYRDYDPNRYLAYTRIMANYDSLSTTEVDSLYDLVMSLAARNKVVAITNESTLRPQIYKAMKHRKYDEALPLLLKAVDLPSNKNQRHQMLRMLIKSAKAQNDTETLADASSQYISMLEQALKEVELQKWRELEILYDLDRTKDEYEKQESSYRKQMLVWGIVTLCVLFLLLIALAILLFRSKHLAHTLADANCKLTQEKDALEEAKSEILQTQGHALDANRQKSAFIKNLVHEVSVPLQTITEYTNLMVSDKALQNQPYLKRYAELITENTNSASMLVHNLGILSQLDSGTLNLRKSKASVKKMCDTAIENIRPNLSPDVVLKIGADSKDQQIITDSRIFEHIITILLSNATKFTSEGSITVEYGANSEGSGVYVAVVDTGIGIDSANVSRIFERYTKLDPTMPGAGIGLTLAQKLARLIGGEIRFVPTPEAGARFELIIN